MATHANPKRYIILQSIVLVISTFLAITTIVDLATGHQGLSLWIAAICWPIVAIVSAYQIIQVRRQLPSA